MREINPVLPPREDATESLCPVCLRRIPAERVRAGDDVCLVKRCPEHGEFAAVVWRGDPGWDIWRRPKRPSPPAAPGTGRSGGCPRDCGLCPEHGQHTCTALLEVTARCDLGCPVCFAASGHSAQPDPGLARVRFWYERVLAVSGNCNVQLSGGEPTMRDDLPEIVALGRELGFSFIQLNTNGLRLARDREFGARLAEAGLASVFLQFDGLDDAALRTLRGRPLAEVKRAAVARCAELGLGVVLVCTVVPGVNLHLLGDIVRFALDAGPAVRGVHLQPVSYFGRYPAQPSDASRATLPELMRALEAQTSGVLRAADFVPPGCEHELCSFSAVYTRTPAGGLARASQQGCCAPPADAGAPRVSGAAEPAGGGMADAPSAAEGARRAVAGVARRWAPPAGGVEATGDFDRFLAEARSRVFTVSAMAFQDAWTVDLERLRGCCVHVVAPDGRLVPFCAWNLTAMDGTPLHRGIA